MATTRDIYNKKVKELNVFLSVNTIDKVHEDTTLSLSASTLLKEILVLIPTLQLSAMVYIDYFGQFVYVGGNPSDLPSDCINYAEKALNKDEFNSSIPFIPTVTTEPDAFTSELQEAINLSFDMKQPVASTSSSHTSKLKPDPLYSKEDKKPLKVSAMCNICCEDFNNAYNKKGVLIPCGHIVCSNCNDKLKKECPTCRKHIIDYIVVYE